MSNFLARSFHSGVERPPAPASCRIVNIVFRLPVRLRSSACGFRASLGKTTQLVHPQISAGPPQAKRTIAPRRAYREKGPRATRRMTPHGASGARQRPPNIARTIEYYRRASHIHGLTVANILHRRKNTVPRRCRSLQETRLPTLSMQASSSWPPTR